MGLPKLWLERVSKVWLKFKCCLFLQGPDPTPMVPILPGTVVSIPFWGCNVKFLSLDTGNLNQYQNQLNIVEPIKTKPMTIVSRKN